MSLFSLYRKTKILAPIIGCICLSSPIAKAQLPQSLSIDTTANTSDESVDDYLILAVVVDRKLASNGIIAIEQNGKYFLPLKDLSNVFGIFLNPTKQDGTISGWINTPKESFRINPQELSLYRGEEKIAISPQSILYDTQSNNNDLYIDLSVLNYLWPVEMSVQLTTLTLQTESLVELPFQKELKRKLNQKNSLKNRNALFPDKGVYPFKPEPYKGLGKPAISLNGNFGYDANTNEYRNGLAVSGVQDLLGTSADYSINLGKSQGSFKNPENLRLRLTRQNIHENALPFDLENVQAGDVQLRTRSLVNSGMSGRGVVLNNIPTDADIEFDVIRVTGVAIPGYEAELYRNDALIEVGVVDTTGIYDFPDIPLSYGNNKITVVLYGPQGQRQEVNESYYIGNNMVKTGEVQYRLGVVDAEKDLIPINERPTNRAEGLAANAQVTYGISKRLSAFTSATTIPTRINGDKDYFSVGFITSAFDALSQFEFFRSSDNGYAAESRILKSVGKYNLNFRLGLFDNFESPSNGFEGNANTLEAESRVRRNFKTPLGNLGLELFGRHEKRENGSNLTRISTRQSISKNRATLSNSFTTNISNSAETSVNGDISATKRYKKLRLRANANYIVKPDFDISNLSLEARKQFNQTYSGSINTNYNLNSKETQTRLQLTKDFDTFLGSAETNWSSRSGAGFMLRASTSFGPYGDNEKYIASSRSLTNATPILADIYHDENYNDVFDTEDRPIENALIQLNTSAHQETSDEHGRLSIIESNRNSPINAKIIPSTIEDPYLQPTIEGYSIYPRPGAIQKLAFPVVDTGAVDATLTDPRNGAPIANTDISLLNSKGRIVQTTFTGQDGYFTLEFLIPDQYTIRSGNIAGLGYFEKEISITPDNLFNFGVDITASDVKKDPLVATLSRTRELLRQYREEN